MNHDQLARTIIGHILDGGSPNGTHPDELGPYAELYQEIVRAHLAGGTHAARRVFIRYAENDPAVAALRAADPETRRRWSAAELLHAEFQPPRWLVEELLPAGLSVLAGRPKLGKSWLALQIAVACASAHGRVLDRPARAQRVLYLALEDSPRRIQDRLRKQHAPAELRLDFQFEIQALDQGGTADIIASVDQHGYELVIVDTVSRALGRADQMSQADMTVIIGSLQRLAVDRDIAILLIDHHRKSAGLGDGDVVDDVMGATGKTGVADALVGLYRKRGERGAILKITGRDVDEQELAVEFDRDTYAWQLLGDASGVREESVQAEILEALDELGGEATVAQVASWLNRDKSNVRKEMMELVARGRLERRPRQGKMVPYRLIEDDEGPR